MTNEELQAQIEALKAQNQALVAEKAKRQKITVKVSQKGAVSVYGLGRFPVTLYGGQWERLLSESQNILDFINTNRDALAVKE